MKRLTTFLLMALVIGLSAGVAGAVDEIYIEAEDANSVEAPMLIWTDLEDASGGAHIAVEPGNNDTGNPPADGLVTYPITVAGGEYKIVGRVIAPSGSDDSFWLRIVDADGQTVETTTSNHSSGWIRYTMDQGDAWHWAEVESMDDDTDPIFIMPEGTYTIQLKYREDGTLLDALVVTSDLTLDPGSLPDNVENIPRARRRASAPSPADGSVDITSPLFEWAAGIDAVAHDVYFGQNPEPDANEFIAQQPIAMTMYFHQAPLEPGATYYWRIDEVDADGNVTTGNVWSFTVKPIKSYDHMPWDGAKFQSVETDLSWKAGQGAVSHDVYMGTDIALVEAGDASVFLGSVGEPHYHPAGLELATTYYWRVDEVDALDNVVAGDVLSFSTTLPGLGLVQREIWEGIGGTNVDDLLRDPNYPRNPTWSDQVPDFKSPPFDPDKNDYGGRLSAWLHVPAAGDYTFWVAGDDNCRLFLGPDLDGAVQIAEVPGWTSVDEWDKYPEQESEPVTLEEGVYYLEALWKEGTGGDSCSAAWQGAGVPTRSLITGGYCEPFIKFMASDPVPAKGTEDVPQWLTVSWWEGVSAAEHDLYGGTNEEAVRNADPTTPGIYLGRVAETSVDLTDLPWGATFFWRIDEVNDADVWPGPVWNFTTAADHIPVVQSALTVDYNNTVEPYITEVARMLDVAQDWTTNGMDSLLLQITGSMPKYFGSPDGPFLLSGAGYDIWQERDEFRYAYKELSGDATIDVLVTDNGTGSNAWAKGGIMIRQSLDEGSVNVFAAVTGGSGDGGTFQRRPEAGGASDSSRTLTGIAPPYWVRLVREGTIFTSFFSADGVEWAEQGDELVDVNMPDPVLVGLAVTSHQSGELRAFQFDGLSITGDVTGDWQIADVGVDSGGNDPAPLYVAVEDTAGNVATVDHPANPDAVMNTDTTPWKVQLDELGGVDLKSIAGISIGVGDGTPDGTGTVTLEDARVVDGFKISLDNANPTPHATVWQLTDHVIAVGETFTLKLRVRVSKGVIRDRNSIKATLYYDDNGKRVPLASKSWWAADGKLERSVSVDTDGKPEAGGKRLGVEFTNLMENWLQIDKVSVTGK